MGIPKRKQPVEQTKQQIITYMLKKLRLSNDTTTRTELAMRFSYHKEYMNDRLQMLREDGIVCNVGHGEWTLTEQYLKEKQL